MHKISVFCVFVMEAILNKDVLRVNGVIVPLFFQGNSSFAIEENKTRTTFL
jgi:hypothetical protein